MAAMQRLSALFQESHDLPMDVLPGDADADADLPPMELGGGNREPAPRRPRGPEEEGPMEEEEEEGEGEEGAQALAAAAAELPALFAGADLEAEELDAWEDELELPEGARRRGAGLGDADKALLRADGGCRGRREKTPFDQLAFIEELFSLMVVNRLTEELGCDEIIDKE